MFYSLKRAGKIFLSEETGSLNRKHPRVWELRNLRSTAACPQTAADMVEKHNQKKQDSWSVLFF